MIASAQFRIRLIVSPCWSVLSFLFSSQFYRPSFRFTEIEKIHDLSAPTSESLPVLVSLPPHSLLSIREEIFKDALALGLTHEGDTLVSRRGTRLNPLSTKLSEDIISLLICIKNESPVPRSLLKNGKRQKAYLYAVRACPFTSNPLSITCIYQPS